MPVVGFAGVMGAPARDGGSRLKFALVALLGVAIGGAGNAGLAGRDCSSAAGGIVRLAWSRASADTDAVLAASVLTTAGEVPAAFDARVKGQMPWVR